MAIYIYKVKNKSGKVLQGEARVQSKEQLEEILLQKELIPLEIKEKNAINDISQISIFKKKVKARDLAVFCRQFAIIMEAGVPIATAMDVLREQMTNSTLKACLNELYDDIQKGVQMSKSMKKHYDVFPEILVHMVEAGEASGQLDKVFTRMADHFEKEYKLNHKVKNALTYPIIVSCVAVAVIIILMAKVVPNFASILEGFGAELPVFTQILINISGFFKNFWWIVVLIIIGFVAGLKAFSKSHNGKLFFGKLAIKLPVIKNVTKNILTARFTRTLGTLTSSGVLLIQAMEITQKVLNNLVISEKINFVTEEIKKGKGITQPLQSIKYFPPMVMSMIRVGEESGNLDFALTKSADFYDQEVETSMQQLTTMIEPIVIIVMAIIVGFIVLSILYPMLSIYSTMSDM